VSGERDSSEAIGWETPAAATSPPTSGADGGLAGLLDEHPEALAGAAFVGGLVTAFIVRRLGR
jgi:hypothetical protein